MSTPHEMGMAGRLPIGAAWVHDGGVYAMTADGPVRIGVVGDKVPISVTDLPIPKGKRVTRRVQGVFE